jgi:hypothetical protein
MKNIETCTVIIRMEENFDSNARFDPETIVKDAWGRMVPWFTERHGIRAGTLTVGDGEDAGHQVSIQWKYETEYDPPTQGEMGCDDDNFKEPMEQR